MLDLFSHRQPQMNIARVGHFYLHIERYCTDSYRASIKFLFKNAVIKEHIWLTNFRRFIFWGFPNF